MPEIMKSSVRFYKLDDSDALKDALALDINEKAILDGWHGIGYHYVIDKMGDICTARPLSEIAIVDEKATKGEIAIALAPDSDAAVESAMKFQETIAEVFRLARREITFHGL